MIPKFIELLDINNIDKKFVNVNEIKSFHKYNPENNTFIKFVSGYESFVDKRTPEEIISLINGTEIQPIKTFPRKMLVHNGDMINSEPYIVIADLGEGFIFRYVCVAWGTEDFFEDGSGCFDTSMYKFAEDIGEL